MDTCTNSKQTSPPPPVCPTLPKLLFISSLGSQGRSCSLRYHSPRIIPLFMRRVTTRRFAALALKVRDSLIPAGDRAIVETLPSSPSMTLFVLRAIPISLHVGDEESLPVDLGCHVTSISWFPPAGKTVVDMFAASCTDGTLRFFKKSGMLDKKIQAHEGAAICVEWNLDGSSLVTSGEDGEVKVWSRNGNLRTQVS